MDERGFHSGNASHPAAVHGCELSCAHIRADKQKITFPTLHLRARGQLVSVFLVSISVERQHD